MTHNSTQQIGAPKVTGAQLRAVLAHPSREGVVLQLPTGDTEAAPAGLTKAQALDPNLVVVLTYGETVDYMAAADGDTEAQRARAAAAAATTVLAWQHERGLL